MSTLVRSTGDAPEHVELPPDAVTIDAGAERVSSFRRRGLRCDSMP
jgi:hypothetical protein